MRGRGGGGWPHSGRVGGWRVGDCRARCMGGAGSGAGVGGAGIWPTALAFWSLTLQGQQTALRHKNLSWLQPTAAGAGVMESSESKTLKTLKTISHMPQDLSSQFFFRDISLKRNNKLIPGKKWGINNS